MFEGSERKERRRTEDSEGSEVRCGRLLFPINFSLLHLTSRERRKRIRIATAAGLLRGRRSGEDIEACAFDAGTTSNSPSSKHYSRRCRCAYTMSWEWERARFVGKEAYLRRAWTNRRACQLISLAIVTKRGGGVYVFLFRRFLTPSRGNEANWATADADAAIICKSLLYLYCHHATGSRLSITCLYVHH